MGNVLPAGGLRLRQSPSLPSGLLRTRWVYFTKVTLALLLPEPGGDLHCEHSVGYLEVKPRNVQACLELWSQGVPHVHAVCTQPPAFLQNYHLL